MKLAQVRNLVQNHRPVLVNSTNRRAAAVALILREGQNGAEILFIERARRDGDPWSGQMAFPGGKMDEDDDSLHDAAVRETLEEVGIDLSFDGRIGRLDDLVAPPTSPAHGLVISCYVFELNRQAGIISNEEVHDSLWISVNWLLDSTNHLKEFRPQGYPGAFPGIRVADGDDRVIWGLTFRFLQGFIKILQPQM